VLFNIGTWRVMPKNRGTDDPNQELAIAGLDVVAISD